MTKRAEQILEIVNHSKEHLSAEQIFLRLKETNKGLHWLPFTIIYPICIMKG